MFQVGSLTYLEDCKQRLKEAEEHTAEIWGTLAGMNAGNALLGSQVVCFRVCHVGQQQTFILQRPIWTTVGSLLTFS